MSGDGKENKYHHQATINYKLCN